VSGNTIYSVPKIQDKSKFIASGFNEALGVPIMTEKLSIEELEAGLNTRVIGHRILYYPSVGSTNDVARALAVTGAPEGIVVLADEQTAGRGRRGRRWLAPTGTCLLFSLLLRPLLAPRQCGRLTMACSLALAESIESQTGLAIGLKWPNDLLARGRKVGGILIELGTEGERLEYAIVGMGLNVNLDFTAPEVVCLRERATSLAQELGAPVAREPLLACILNRLEARYLALCDGWLPHQEWMARLVMLDQKVVISGLDSELEGWAEGVDRDGALLLRLRDDQMLRVLAGDVSLRPVEGQPTAT